MVLGRSAVSMEAERTPEDVAERVADRINARLGVRPLLRCERRRQDAQAELSELAADLPPRRPRPPPLRSVTLCSFSLKWRNSKWGLVTANRDRARPAALATHDVAAAKTKKHKDSWPR